MLRFFGKLLFVIALCLQGSLMIQGLDSQLTFNTNVNHFISAVPQLSFISQFGEFYDMFRYALVGLYGFSFFILMTSCCYVPLLTVIGVILNTIITYYPALLTNPSDINMMANFLKNLSIIGGLFYLMGASCPRKEKKKIDWKTFYILMSMIYFLLLHLGFFLNNIHTRFLLQ